MISKIKDIPKEYIPIMKKHIEYILNKFPQTEIIALAGSRNHGNSNNNSDWDYAVYPDAIYYSKEIDILPYNTIISKTIIFKNESLIK